MKILYLLGFALFLLGSTDFGYAEEKGEDAWVAFDGNAVKSGDSYLLIAWKDKAILEMGEADVRVIKSGDSEKVEIKTGAKVKNIKVKEGKSTSTDFTKTLESSENPGRTYCVGVLEFCCGSGKVFQSCIGAWDCTASGHVDPACP
jgi:hypothetical protein